MDDRKTTTERNADPSEYQRALAGVAFPASRDQLVQAAKDTGGLDTEVQWMLSRIPAKTYESMPELQSAISAAYVATDGGLGDAGAAAPTGGQAPDPAVNTPVDNAQAVGRSGGRRDGGGGGTSATEVPIEDPTRQR